ncbi:uncharacterized protein CHSO_1630 [Chryseobacterium sp. StRB126]|nr:uncharacterized protein CHSO_1630 [Chryseobacterium sp. StRB126]
MSWNGFKAQQGIDYVIMLDNGSSTTNDSYTKMKRGAVKLMEQLLACNPAHRVAVVQYGVGKYGDTSGIFTPMIYIESDFTSDQFIVQNFKRRLDFGDHFHESLGLVGDALDGNPNPDIVSSQTTLNQLQPLRVVVFTDAERNAGNMNGSYLVNFNNTNYGSPQAFSNMLKFKNDRYARFTVVHANTNIDAVKAAASIASGGGDYSGPIETVPGDPNNGSMRLYYNRPNGFGMTAMETNYWKDIAEKICDYYSYAGAVNFKYEPGECINRTSDISGYYHLNSLSTLIEFKLDLVNLQTGNAYPIVFNPTFGSGNFFQYNFQPSDFDAAVNAGATGEHKFRVTMRYLEGSEYKVAYSWNNYPFFDYDITMDCSEHRTSNPLTAEKIFKLTPNPTNGLFKVILNKGIKSGTVEIRDLVGNPVYNKILRGEKEIDIDLSSRKEGVYIVNVITDKNEIYSEKIIKK